MTDYERDRQRLSTEGDLETVAGCEGVSRKLARRFQRIVLGADLRQIAELDQAVALAIDGTSYRADLWLLRSFIAITRHRFGEAEKFLGMEGSLRDSGPGALLQSDVDWQLGRYARAQDRIEAGLARERSWDGLARLANCEFLMGHHKAADALLVEAEDELTAKEMRSFAWIEVRRGLIHFARGRYEEAMGRYECARQAYSGYWLVEERIAEALGAMGDYEVATSELRRLWRSFPRPEWAHALGDLYALAGDHGAANEWRLEALKGYLEPVERGECFPYQALVDVCCELPGEGANAVMWARKDLAIRENYATQGELAWALYRQKDAEEAAVWMTRAVASGVVSARLFVQAACVFGEVGMVDRSREMMRLARSASPVTAKARVPMRSLGLVSA